MLKLKHALRPARFIGSAGLTTRSNALTVQNVLDTLDTSDVLEAYPLVLALRDKHSAIPPSVMTKFYESVKRNSCNPLAIDCFTRLVTVQQVGPKHFSNNVERVISLYLENNSWEMCIAFIREIELANKGELVFSYETLESLLISAKWHNDPEIALQLVQIMQSTYPNVYGRTWGLLAQCLLANEDYNGLDWLHRTALIPGLLVLDDASYVKLAKVAATHGDLRLCEWAALRMRRRQRALKAPIDPRMSLQMYIYLIEAASSSASKRAALEGGQLSPENEHYDNFNSAKNNNSHNFASIKAVCRYLVRLGRMASNVSVRDLPQTVQALASNESNDMYTRELFDTISNDSAVENHVKTLVFNLLLATKVLSSNTSIEDVVRIVQSGGADSGVELNEDSVICLLELASKFKTGDETLEAIAMQQRTPKVQKYLRHFLSQQ